VVFCITANNSTTPTGCFYFSFGRKPTRITLNPMFS
jgi:hypothetical protein